MKYHSKFLLAVWIGLLMLTLFACQNKEPVVVGFSMDNFVTDRWEKDRDYFVHSVQEMGGEVILETAQGDPLKQIKQVKRLIEQGVDVLVVIPSDQLVSSEVVELGHNAGIPVVSYDRLIKDSDADLYISFDNVKVGELQAEYLTKIRPKGKYVQINGPTFDNNSFLIKLGQNNVLQPLIERGDINLVYETYAKSWKPEAAAKIMRRLLETTDSIDAVLAANDALAQGVIQALEETGRAGQVLVSGQDADLYALKNIINGKQTMTVYKPISLLAQSAAEAAIQLAREEKLENTTLSVNNGYKLVESILLKPQLVNKSNIELTVIQDGYWTKEELYN